MFGAKALSRSCAFYRIAAGLAPLMHLQLRVVEKTGIERRLAKLERQLQVVLDEDRPHSDK